ncbi:MAG: hypothetical protein GX491_22520 [Chloroflexi bacterium]|nr:hypothetical protein [Chloroflexota bacterium]
MDDQTAIIVETPEEDQGQGFASRIVADNFNFGPGLVIGVEAKGDVHIENAGAIGVAAGQDANLTNGGAFAMAAGRDLNVTNGGSTVLTAGRNAEIKYGGAMAVTAGQVSAQNSIFGIVIAQETHLSEGSRVLLDTKQAAVFGAALGAALAVVGWLLRRK